MPNNQFDEKQSHASYQRRPQRGKNNRIALLIYGVGSLIVIGVIVFIVLQVFAPQTITGKQGSTPISGNHSTSPGKGGATPSGTKNVLTDSKNSGAALPPAFWNTAESTMAQGMHLSVADLQSKLQASTHNTDPKAASGDALTALAAQQGLSTDQLRTLEINAAQKGYDTLVTQGALTHADVEQKIQEIQQYDQNTLNSTFVSAILQNNNG